MPDRRLVIFDFDGTLVDSHKHYDQSLVEFATARNLPYDHDKILVGWAKPLEYDLGFGVPLAEQPDILKDYYTYLNAEIAEKNRFIPDPYDGVVQTLAILAKDYDLGIVTARSRNSMLQTLDMHGLRALFPAYRTYTCAIERAYAVKPAPDALFCLARETGHVLSDIVMVGDTTMDIDMANAAGVKSVAVLWGAQSAEIIAASKPTATIGEVGQLPAAIASVFIS